MDENGDHSDWETEKGGVGLGGGVYGGEAEGSKGGFTSQGHELEDGNGAVLTTEKTGISRGGG